ncbi:MAG: hypothetical protein K2X29_01205, partial [Candidatus Obscuribacterales bacterium]|nr:hypothetical protein [Candidatus Obscuribacterales bacterium]
MSKRKISIRYIFLALMAISGMNMLYAPVFADESVPSIGGTSSAATGENRIDMLFNAALAKLKQNRPDEARNLLIEASQL